MVFFESKRCLQSFFNSSSMQQLRSATATITEHVEAAKKDAVFQKATEQGSITLMVREFGRGTDFKCFDSKMLHEGGVHVIQSFFSTDVAEEIQIKGRCARQGANGSFSMVLNLKQLSRDFSISKDDFDMMRSRRVLYSFIHSKRVAKYSGFVNVRSLKVDQAEELHYRTIACTKALSQGKSDNREAMRFICELNKCGASVAFKQNGLKNRMLAARDSRLQAQIAEDRMRRQKAREIWREEAKVVTETKNLTNDSGGNETLHQEAPQS